VSERIEQLHRDVAFYLDRIRESWKPEQRERVRLTFLARHLDYPDGSRDVLISEDDTESIVYALRELAMRPKEQP